MRKASRQEVQKAIHEGIVFRKSKNQGFEDDKVRTKAKKKAYRTGSHGSNTAPRNPSADKHNVANYIQCRVVFEPCGIFFFAYLQCIQILRCTSAASAHYASVFQ